MSYRVRVRPSGHEFDAGPRETLLDAGLQAGLALSFHCSSGTCGECRARVIEGEVKPHGHQDFAFSETERAANWVLMCRNRAASDLLIEAEEAGSAKDIPLQELDVKVAKLERLHDDMIVAHLRTPRSQTLRFLAGQYVTMELRDLPPRDKSIASCPCNGLMIQVHFRQRDDDPFPEYVFAHLKNGEKLKLTGPFGDFTLDEVSPLRKVFIAFETGFASTKSLIEHLIALDMEVPVDLHWIVLEEGRHYLDNQCRAWEGSLDDFRYQPLILSTMEPTLDEALTDRIRTMLAGYESLNEIDLYLSVPADTGTALRKILCEQGMPQERIHMELLEKY
ncbi:MAG: 2Fe-2S iron-sulfur cluster binding domain-containing protein [Chromatiales bacterium]|nr:2Fe-2S iron-sulfur cluster binding domain-containing protein [Chromatiales bacterium]